MPFVPPRTLALLNAAVALGLGLQAIPPAHGALTAKVQVTNHLPSTATITGTGQDCIESSSGFGGKGLTVAAATSNGPGTASASPSASQQFLSKCSYMTSTDVWHMGLGTKVAGSSVAGLPSLTLDFERCVRYWGGQSATCGDAAPASLSGASSRFTPLPLAAGAGAAWITTSTGYTNRMNLCNTPQCASMPVAPGPAGQVAGARPARAEGRARMHQGPSDDVTDLLDVGALACQVAGGSSSACDGAATWSGAAFPGVSASGGDQLSLPQGAAATTSLGMLCGPITDNPDPTPGATQCTYSQTTGTSATTTTMTSHQVGFQVAVGVKTGAFFEEESLGLTFSASWNWSSSLAQTTSTQTQDGLSHTFQNLPNTRAVHVLYQDQAQGQTTYGSGLSFTTQAAGVDRAIISRMFTDGLGMSTSANQTCIGYLAGATSVNRSIMNISEQYQQSGKLPTADSEALAGYAAAYSPVTGSGVQATCVGFPAGSDDGYWSGFDFAATGVTGPMSSFGSGVTSCSWYDPAPPPPPGGAAPTSCPADPPTAVEAARGGGPAGVRRGTGALHDLARRPGALHQGTTGSNFFRGDAEPDRDVVVGGPAFDVLYGGPGSEVARGGAGRDLLSGRGGDDVLAGGEGNDQLEGGSGDDVIHTGSGRDLAEGGPGDDRIVAVDADRSLLRGGRGDDRIEVRSGDAQMWGGPGDDTYVIRRAGDHVVGEVCGHGRDLLLSHVDVRVPRCVEQARLVGAHAARVTGSSGRDIIHGNAAANRLAGGPGRDRVHGHGGDDHIVLGRFGHDLAFGGAGADIFEVQGVPLRHARVASLARPARRTAHRIPDFRVADGDRIRLLARHHGATAISQLRAGMQVIRQVDPRPTRARAQVLADTRTGLITLDPDGTGPLDDVVLVTIPPDQASLLAPGAFRLR